MASASPAWLQDRSASVPLSSARPCRTRSRAPARAPARRRVTASRPSVRSRISRRNAAPRIAARGRRPPRPPAMAPAPALPESRRAARTGADPARARRPCPRRPPTVARAPVRAALPSCPPWVSYGGGAAGPAGTITISARDGMTEYSAGCFVPRSRFPVRPNRTTRGVRPDHLAEYD